MKKINFTEEELKAFDAVFDYVDCERADYERCPVTGHIWLQIRKAKKAVERVRKIPKRS